MIKLIAENKIKLIFALMIVVGVYVHKDYGLSIDDEIYRLNGIFYKDFIIKYLFNLYNLDFSNFNLLEQEISNNPLSNHPALFEIILAFIEDVFSLKDTNIIFSVSHFINYSIYIFSLALFYKLLKKRFNSEKVAIFSILLIYFYPRFFAESFYNSRDIFFVSIFIINLYSLEILLTLENKKNIILFAFTTALLISTKILGLICFLIFLFIYSINKFSYQFKKKDLKKLIFLLLFILFFLIILWPYLWLNPLDNLIKAYTSIIKDHDDLEILTLFLGDYYISTDAPSYYRIIWFFITTPIIVCLLFLIGISFLFNKTISQFSDFVEKKIRIYTNKNNFLDTYLFLTLISIVLLTMIYNSSQFNGWRHLYFLFIPVIYISAYAYLILMSNKRKFIKILINCLVLLSLVYNTFWIIKFHPFQNNYFNILSKKFVQGNFDIDYWGLSNYQSIKFIIEEDKRDEIKIASMSFADLYVSFLRFNDGDKKRVKIVHKYEEADYIINTYMKRIGKDHKINVNNFTKFYEIKIDNIIVNTVFKKNENL